MPVASAAPAAAVDLSKARRSIGVMILVNEASSLYFLKKLVTPPDPWTKP